MIYNPYIPTNQGGSDEWTDSELNAPDEETWPDEPGDEQCKSESMLEWTERTQLVKPTGHCVRLNNNGVEWRV